MSVSLQSTDAGKALNTVPLVEPDGAGGHVPYTRLDTTPTQTYPPAQKAILDVLVENLEVLKDLLLEARATRIAVSDLVNNGTVDQTDYLELAQQARDSAEEI